MEQFSLYNDDTTHINPTNNPILNPPPPLQDNLEASMQEARIHPTSTNKEEEENEPIMEPSNIDAKNMTMTMTTAEPITNIPKQPFETTTNHQEEDVSTTSLESTATTTNTTITTITSLQHNITEPATNTTNDNDDNDDDTDTVL